MCQKNTKSCESSSPYLYYVTVRTIRQINITTVVLSEYATVLMCP